MRKILVASNNEHKIKEIKEILMDLPVEVISMKEGNIDIEVEETGTTFEENAYIKASEIYKLNSKYMVLADDSGLEVDSLGGAPGVYSARFAGEHGNDRKNNEKLLDLLKGKPSEERKARFVCSIVLVVDDIKTIKVEGYVEGYISESQSGIAGFGYDPLFFIPEYGMTFGEMDSDKKNLISHRGRALKKLKEELNKLLQEGS